MKTVWLRKMVRIKSDVSVCSPVCLLTCPMKDIDIKLNFLAFDNCTDKDTDRFYFIKRCDLNKSLLPLFKNKVPSCSQTPGGDPHSLVSLLGAPSQLM